MSHPLENPSIEMAKKISEGEVPSNVEIEKVLDTTRKAVENQPSIGQYGARLTSDLRETIEDVKTFIEEKNPNEEIQKLVRETKDIVQETSAKTPQALQQGQELYLSTQQRLKQMNISGEGPMYRSLESLRRAAMNLFESAELRRFLFEFIALIQDIISFSLSKHQQEIASAVESNKPLTEKAVEVAEATSNIAKEISTGPVPISKERREDLHQRWRLLISSAVRNPDLVRALNEMLALFDDMKPQLQSLVTEAQEKAHGLTSEIPNSVDRARADIVSMICNFTGRESWNRFTSHLNKIYDRIATDEEATRFFQDFRGYLRQTLENPPLMEDENHLKKFQDFFNRSYDLLDKWNSELRFDSLLWEGRYMLLKIANDPTTLKIMEDLRALGKDLFLDSRGRPSLQVTAESVGQIRSLLLPVLLENLKSIPVPVIIGSTPKYDYRLEDVVFRGYDILPENIRVHMETNFDINVTGNEQTALPTSVLTFKFRKIKVHMKNVKFDFYRKVIPRIHDKGVADFDISGDRTRITVKFQVTFTDIGPIFTLLKTKTHIKNLDINVKEAHHKLLYNTIVSLFRGTVKQNIEDTIDGRLRQMLLMTEKNLNSLVRSSNILGTSTTTVSSTTVVKELPASTPIGVTPTGTI